MSRPLRVWAAHLSDMDAEQMESRGLDPLMSVDELAEYLGVPVRTVYDWRTTGHGPRGIRIGRHLKYSVPDVAAWLKERRDASPGSS